MSEPAEILSLLQQNDPELVRRGAQMAGEEMTTAAIPYLVRHIASPNIGVQEAVDRALRKIGGPAVVHAVIPSLRSDNAPARNMAMDLLRVLGKNDLPALQELLRDEDPDVRIFAADILGSTGSALAVASLCHALLNDPEVNVRYQAAVSLGQLAFAESAPCLNSALDDEEWVQFSVIEALIKIKDASSIGAMVKALGKSSELVSSIMVDALGEMGNIKAVPQLIKGLDSAPTPLCNKIVRAVLNIMGERSLSLLGSKECRRLAGYLPSALEDDDPDIQDSAVRSFAALGVEGATTYILRHVDRLDPERDAERAAIASEALIKLGRNPELDAAVRNPNEHIATTALGVMLNVDEKAAISMMIETFPNRSRDMQRVMIMELAARAGREHQDFFLKLLENTEDGNLLRGVLYFLGKKGDPAVVLDKILPFLGHPYNDVKEAALEACIAMHTPEVEQVFHNLMQDADPVQRMIGAYGLGFFPIENSLGVLSAALDDPSPDVRKVAAEALGKNADAHPEYMELLENKLLDESRDVRLAVYDALGRCTDPRFYTYLIQGLNDPDPWVCVRCAECLGEKKVMQAIEPLVGMLADENTLIVVKAVSVLGSLGGETAFRALLPMLDHPDPDVRAAAEEAVNAIHKQAGEE
ncbi:MAG: HEAT repeat domain-containing protein [Desulfovibrio sp.]|jgi:HEAT repeat protein|nr:HEAT repeat domain-containing protein [Desulfovibrio sp.]